jgi:hypothetical protein
MSHRRKSPTAIEVLSPVTTLALAAEAARAGARLVEPGDRALAESIRRAGLDVLICGPDNEDGPDNGADANWDLLICAGLAAAEEATRRGHPRDRIVVQIPLSELTADAATEDGWRTLVDVDPPARYPDAEAATRAGAVAAVCAWLGAGIVRTKYASQVRPAVLMTEAVLGTRHPAWAVRGLA